MTRTTIDVDPTVLRELKARGKREGKTLGQLVSELLAVRLVDETPAQPGPLEWYSKPMRARVDLDDAESLRRALEA
jgi:hypothetical protein